MATGDITAYITGPYTAISGAAIISALNGLNLGTTQASGGRIEILPVGNGQISILKILVTGW